MHRLSLHEAAVREMSIYTPFTFLVAATIYIEENFDSILTHVYLIWPEVLEGYTEYTARFCIESAQREGCSLRKEIEQLGIECNISVRMKSWQSRFLTVVRCLRIINLPHTA